MADLTISIVAASLFALLAVAYARGRCWSGRFASGGSRPTAAASS